MQRKDVERQRFLAADRLNPVGHNRAHATRPVRVAVALAFAVMILGPQSFRFSSRDPGAVLFGTGRLGIDGSIHAALVVSGTVLAALLLAARPVRRYWASVLRGNVYSRVALWGFAAWLLWAGLSVLWSLAPMFTAFSWLRLAATAGLLAVLVPLGRDRLSLVRFFWWFSVAKCALITALGVVDPALVGATTEIGFRLTGGLLPDYGVSGYLLVTSSLALVLARRHGAEVPRPLQSPLLASSIIVFGFAFALLGRSRYVILSLLLALAVAGWAHRVRVIGVAAGVAATLVALADSPIVSDAAFDIVFRGRQNVMSYSARDLALEHVLAWSADMRWLGGGYGAGARAAMADFMARSGIAMGAPHDVVSSVVPDLGVVGAALLSLLGAVVIMGMIPGMLRLRWVEVAPFALFSVSFTVLALASSVSGPGIAGPDELLPVSLMLLTLMMSPPARSSAPVDPLPRSA